MFMPVCGHICSVQALSLLGVLYTLTSPNPIKVIVQHYKIQNVYESSTIVFRTRNLLHSIPMLSLLATVASLLPVFH